MNRLQGVLPLLFDRDPRNVLFMCFGSGITCGTLALSPFAHIDAVEIAPGVIEAAPLFNTDNLGVLTRPNVQVHIDDGRNYLLTTRNTYDVITFEPMPLALAGVSTFYTREYYSLCLNRLNPGGLVSQWVPLHSLNLEVVHSLVYTFTQVFPDYCAFFVNADAFLIGSNQPLHLDYARIVERLNRPELKAALDKVGLSDPPEVVASFLMDKPAVDDFAKGGRVMTDDRPWAEFIAPKLVYARKVQESIDAVPAHATSPEKLLLPGLDAATLNKIQRRFKAHKNDFAGLRQYYGGMSIGTEAFDSFAESLAIDPDDFNARFYLKQLAETQCRQFLRWEDYAKLKTLMETAVQRVPGEPLYALLLADALWGLKEQDQAREYYQRYLNLGGQEPHALERVAPTATAAQQ
jgi:spermidine synthase